MVAMNRQVEFSVIICFSSFGKLILSRNYPVYRDRERCVIPGVSTRSENLETLLITRDSEKSKGISH
jgi:hypothetical protein